ncbi:MAG TPA: amidohydrolase family protein [Acidimicrobiales bacterium]|nr:amidohydrolase family protein [Acidimicrobiales bacterium]
MSVRTVVDVHAHVAVPSLLAGEGPDAPWRPRVRLEDGRQVQVELAGRSVDSIVAELSRIDVVVAEAAATGVDRLVVSPWVSMLPVTMDRGAAAELCRAHNEGLAAAVRGLPGRVDAFGAVPLQDASLAATVLAEARAAGLVGVEIMPSAEGRWLGHPSFAPFWEAAESLGAPVFVHPSTRGLGMDVFNEYYLWNAVANPVETAIAASHLVMSGVLERHPGLIVVLAHGGGVLPSLAGRLDRAWRARPEARLMLREPPERSLKRLRFDTVTHDRTALAALVAAVGADHVLLGSDRPFDMGCDDPVGEVRALGLSPADEALVLGRNALAMLERAGRP